MKYKIVAITINYNNALSTVDTVNSLINSTDKHIELEIIVVDNGSTATDHKLLFSKLKTNPKITLLTSSENLGFAGGNNLAICSISNKAYDYVLLINNDATVISENFFSKMIDKNFDITSPLVKYYSNKKLIKVDYGGKVDWLMGRNSHFEVKPQQQPDYYSGVCLLIKKRVINMLPGLNKKYFLYYEDADYCLSARKQGFSLGLCFDASIKHCLSLSTNRLGKNKIKILADSHWIFCRNNLPATSLPFYALYNFYLRLKFLLP